MNSRVRLAQISHMDGIATGTASCGLPFDMLGTDIVFSCIGVWHMTVRLTHV